MPSDFTPCSSCKSPMACRDVATCQQSSAPKRGSLVEMPPPPVIRMAVPVAIPTRRYTQAELEAAFNRVKPSPHWKAQIDCKITVVKAGELEVIREAVIYFTGSVPEFRLLRVLQDFSEVYQVAAAGYWETIGA